MNIKLTEGKMRGAVKKNPHRKILPPPAPEPIEWQPIETAPNTDKDILTWSEEFGYHISSYEDKAHRRGFNHRNGHHQATHWMPLPQPPQEGE